MFAYINDPHALPNWLVGIEEVRDVIGAGEGMQYEWSFSMAGIVLRGQSVVVEYEENRRTVHQGIGMGNGVWCGTVEQLEKGTRLTMDVEYSLPFFVLGRLAERATIGRIDRDIKTSLAKLQAILESG